MKGYYAIQQSFLLIGFILLSLFYSAQLLFFSILLVLIQILVFMFFQVQNSKQIQKCQQKVNQASGELEECFESMKTIVANNAQNQKLERVMRVLKKVEQSNYKKQLKNALNWGIFFALNGIYLGLVWYLGSLIIDQEQEDWISGQELDTYKLTLIYFAMSQSAFLFFGSLLLLADFIYSVKLMKYSELKQLEQQGEKLQVFEGAVRFINVGFVYPNSKEGPVFDDLSFEILPGQNVAILGNTGCGKSTILELIFYYYPSYKGDIFIDNKNLRDLDIKTYRSFIGIVNQEPVLFYTSIRDNILMGKKNASQDQVEEALRVAEAAFVKRLEKGLDTVVGVKGLQLSGGQKQRIAIARAIIRKPKMLLMDEATSALDYQTEKKVMENIQKQIQQGTLVVVTHRKSIIDQSFKVIDLYYRDLKPTEVDQWKNSQYYLNTLEIQQKEQNIEIGAIENKVYQTLPSSSVLKIIFKYFSTQKMNSLYFFIAIVLSIPIGWLWPYYGYAIGDITYQILYEETFTEKALYYLYSILVIACIQLILFLSSTHIFCYSSQNFINYFTKRAYSNILSKSGDYFDDPENAPANLALKLSSSILKMHNITGITQVFVVMAVSSFITTMVFSISINAQIGVVFTFISVVYFLVNFKGKTFTIPNQEELANRTSEVVASDVFNNIKTVKAFNLSDYFEELFYQLSEKWN